MLINFQNLCYIIEILDNDFILFSAVLGMDTGALLMLGKCSTNELSQHTCFELFKKIKHDRLR